MDSVGKLRVVFVQVLGKGLGRSWNDCGRGEFAVSWSVVRRKEKILDTKM